MTRELRLLLVEDSDEDAELLLRQLRADGFEPVVTRVQTAAAFRSSLRAQPAWDVIVSDHAIPGYSGIDALADLRATGQDVPFILVSGTIGEEVAVEAMRAGAVDYVLKRDLRRLPAAIDRELREKAARTESARMRERLELSDRMASVGTLAAGVAHEINNPLAIAVANVDLVAEAVSRVLTAETTGEPVNLGELRELQDQLRDAREALARIRNIVRDIRLFSRPEEQATHPVDLRRVIESSLRMAYNEIRHRARLVKDYGAVSPVMANESRLGQVLVNLVVNAAQAIPEGRAEDNEIRVTTRAAGPDVVIEVKDTGAGIPPDRLARIFEPFYTTKPVGVGTGLGLAICHRIVTELRGTIEVESQPGRGTLFRVVLPATGDSAAVVTRTVSAVTLASGAAPRARVLVVDDEAPIGIALQRLLGEHHDVFPLTRGRDALDRIEDGERFDVILSDLLMPDMSGIELYERLRHAAPEQAERMVFVTGGAFTPAARDFLDRVPNPRIEKPFEPANLLAIIAGVTRRRDPSRVAEVSRA
jgi:signal transduction histidine kinase